MNKELVYYVPGVEYASRQKHLLFLQKNGFNVLRINTLDNLSNRVASTNPVAIILNDETLVVEILPLIGNLPIIILSKNPKNIVEITSTVFPEMKNLVFFRTEADPIDTVVETVRLIEDMKKTAGE
jgi:hypothetical protein